MYQLSAVEEEEIQAILKESVEEINRPFARRGMFSKKEGVEEEPLFNIIMRDEPYKNISTVMFFLTISDDMSAFPSGIQTQKGSEAFVNALLRAAQIVADLNSMNYLVMREVKRGGGMK